MTARYWFFLAGIPLTVAGACLSFAMGPPLSFLFIPIFLFMALALTAALIWGREC